MVVQIKPNLNLVETRTSTRIPLPKIVKTIALYAILFLGISSQAFAQVTVTGSAAGTYTSVAAAVTALNGVGTMAAPTTVDIVSTHTETAPVGGFSLSATGTAANPLVINGNNCTLTAASGLTAGSLHDAVIELLGSDFVTLNALVLRENGNSVYASATNTMTEWGIALINPTVANGCQNVTITNCNIQLNRLYTNSHGIYANSNHSATAPTTTAAGTGTSANHNNLTIQSNSISLVNDGIHIVGPSGAAADFSSNILIGGASASLGNTISSYGSGLKLSSFATASTTVNGIFVKNATGITIRNNTIQNNTGTWTTSATLWGIQLPTANATAIGTFTNTISDNVINLTHGIVGAGMLGIGSAANSASPNSSLIINANNFTGAGNSVAASTSTFTGISATAPYLNMSITNNTFTNISFSASGLFTFISHSHNMPTNGTEVITGNSIVGTWTRTVSGTGGITILTTGGSSPSTATSNISNNNFSNITNIGSGSITCINQIDGAGSSNNPYKSIFNNIFNNISSGSGSCTGININWVMGTVTAGTSNIRLNTITNINTAGAITGIAIGSSGQTTVVNGLDIYSNTINNLNSTGGSVIGINNTASTTLLGNININNHEIFNLSTSGAFSVSGISIAGGLSSNVFKNKIYDLTTTNSGGSVQGILSSSGGTSNIFNNYVGNLNASTANASNAVIGISISGGTAANVDYNTVHLNASSSGALFGSSALSASTTPNLTMRNNILHNASAVSGAGLAAAYRRSSTTLTTYQAASGNNDFIGSTLYTDGTTTATTLSSLITALAPRDAASVSFAPTYLSTTGSSSSYLHIDGATPSPIESGGIAIAGINDDYDADIRQGSGGYLGTGTAPDMGADEGNFISLGCSAPAVAAITSTTPNRCVGQTVTLTSSGASTGAGYSYQWKVATTPSGPYSNVVGGTGATSLSYTSAALAAGTFYYVLETTCNVGPSITLSNEFIVNVNSLPVLSSTPASGAICNPGGTAVSLLASSPSAVSFAWSPATGLSSTTTAATSADPTANTTYTVIGTDAVGCTGTTSVGISVNIIPTVNSAVANPASICSGANTNLSATASFSVATTSTAAGYAFTSSTSAYTPLTGATTFTAATGDDGTQAGVALGFDFNYFGTNYSTITVSTNGVAFFGAVPTSHWTNELQNKTLAVGPLWDDNHQGTGSVNYLLSGTAPNRKFTIEWLNTAIGGGGSSLNSTNQYQMILNEGSNKINFLYGALTDLNGITASIGLSGPTAGQFVSVTPGATPTASTATVNNGIAGVASLPSGTLYEFAPSTVTPVNNFTWDNAAKISGSNVGGSVTTTNLIANEIYTVTANNGGCFSTATVLVTVGAALTCNPIIAGGATNCTGVKTINASVTGGGAPYQYAWKVDGSAIAATTNTIAAVGGTHDYEVTITDACNVTCVTTLTNELTNQTPTATTTPSSACVGLPLAIEVTTVGGTSFEWSGPASFASVNQNNSITAAVSANAGVYTVVVTGAGGCTTTASLTAVVNSNPLISTSVSAGVICLGSSTTLTASIPAASAGLYCIPSATNNICLNADEFISNVSLNTINNSTTCDAIAYKDLTAITTSLTAGSSYTLTMTNGNGYTGDQGRAWIDFNNDGDFIDAGEEFLSVGATTTSFPIPITIPAGAINGPKRLRVRLTYTTGMAPCGNSSYGETEDYTVNIIGGVAGNSYTWDPGAANGAELVASPTSTTVYTATATNAAGCTATATTEVTVNPLPIVTTSGDATICEGASANITASGADTYSWMPGALSGAVHSLSPLSTTVYTITGTTTATGCTSTTTVTVNVNSKPTATVDVTTPITCNGDLNGAIEATPSGSSPLSIVWDDASTMMQRSGLGAGTYTAVVTDANGCTTNISYTLMQPAAVGISFTGLSDVSCFTGSNGQVTVTPTGGSAPYIVVSSDGTSGLNLTSSLLIENLSAGTYTVDVLDANLCSYSTTFVITEPSAIVLSASAIDVTCNGGSNGAASVVTSGGTGTYTYSWSTNPVQTTATATGLSAGDYTITVTDLNNCSATTSTNVAEPGVLGALANITNVSCNGAADGTASAAVTGGTAPYTYSWNTNPIQTTTGISNLTPGTYVVTITDANLCSVSTVANISEPITVTVSAGATNVSCNGAADGTITASGSAGSTITVNGSTPAAAYGPGTYTVMASAPNGNGNGSCTASTTVTISEPIAVTVSASATNVSCNGAADGTITASGSAGSTITVNGSAPAAAYGPGTYTVMASASNGNGNGSCTASTTVMISEPIAVTVSASATNVSCNGAADGTITASGSAGSTITVNGSTPAAAYGPGTYTVMASAPNGNGNGSCTASTTVTISEPIAVTVSASATNVSCNGAADGTITASGSAGSSITVNGSAPAAAYGPGTYTVMASAPNGNGNGSCTASTTVTISEPIAVTVNASATNVSCNGAADGSITANGSAGSAITVNGSAPAATYGPGTYTVMASAPNGDGNGSCTASTTVTISEPIAVTVSASATDVSCNGAADGTITASGSAGSTITVNGSTPAAAYGPGTYTVMASAPNGNGNGSCTASTTVTISEPIAVTVSASATNVSCNGAADGTITASGSAGSTITVNGSTPAATYGPGTYTVMASAPNGNGNGSCTASTTVTISEPIAVTVNASATNVSCNGAADGTITASGSAGSSITVNGSALAAAYSAGTYTVMASAPNGNGNGSCTASTTVTISEPIAVTVNASATNVSCNGAADGTITASGSAGSAITVNGSAPAAAYGPGTYTVMASAPNGNGNGSCTASTTVMISEPIAVTVSASATNVSCNGAADGTITASGSAGSTITVNGSTPAAAYGPGTYTVMASAPNGNGNGSCTASTTVTISEPIAVTVSASATNVSCNGAADGTITASGSAGSSITVNGSAPAAAYGPGTYTVMASAPNGNGNGSCTASTTVTISEPIAVTVNASATNVSCNGAADGSITANGSAGSAITVNGSAPAAAYGPGTYTVMASAPNGDGNGSCTASTTVTISEPIAVTVSASATDVSCNGAADGTITASGSAGSTITVNGSTPAAAYGPGTYTVMASAPNGNGNGSCTASTTVTISEPIAVTVSASATNVSCNGAADGTITASGSAGSTITVNGSTPAATYGPGTYTVMASAPNGNGNGSCTASTTVTISEPIAVTVNASATNVSCNGAADGTITASGSAGSSITVNGSAPAAAYSAGTYTVMASAPNGNGNGSCIASTIVVVTQPTAVTLSAVGTNPAACLPNSGSIAASAVGGTGTINYAIMPNIGTNAGSGSFTNLTAGSYTITATDNNGCSSVASTILAQTPGLQLTAATVVMPSCFGRNNGSIAISTVAAPGAVSYVITPSLPQASAGLFINAAGGSYTLTATSGACSASTIISVGQPAAINLANVAQSPTCNGVANGSITAIGNGGSGSIIYSLTPANGIQPIPGTFANLPGAIYVVRAIDGNGCSTTKVVILPQPPVVKFTTIGITHPTCNGGTNGAISALTTGGVGARTLSINPTATVSSPTSYNNVGAGNYTLTVTDGNACTKTTTVLITAPTAIVWYSVVSNAATTGTNGSIAVAANGGTGTKTYALTPATGVQAPSGTFNGLSNGSYTATATDARGCTSTTAIVLASSNIVVNNGNVSNETIESEIKVYPNPTNGEMRVSMNSFYEGAATVLVTDMQGKVVRRVEVALNKGENIIEMSISDVTNGMYMLQVLDASGNRYNKPVTKQ